MPLCEVRIPTYRRPNLLRRCLTYLQQQIERDFVCIVCDDSPDREAESVVSDFTQLKIDYRPNPKNLGISQNLGMCFRTAPFTDAAYAFCCEDDNYVLPNFIRDNVNVCSEQQVNLVVRDQSVETPGGEICPHYTTMWRCFREGRHEAATALAAVFPCGGIANGSLFWATAASSELGIGLDCADPKLVEYMRPFAVREPWAFIATPAAVWHADPVSSFRMSRGRAAELTRKAWRQVAIARIRRRAIERLHADGQWPSVLEELAPHVRERVEWTTAWACRPVDRLSLRRWSVLRRYLMGAATMHLRGPSLGSFEQALRASA